MVLPNPSPLIQTATANDMSLSIPVHTVCDTAKIVLLLSSPASSITF